MIKILIYILTPVVGYIFELILSFIIPIVTIPVTWFISLFQKNNSVYRFRPDMVFSGILTGFILVNAIYYFLSLFESEISFWWVVASVIWLAYLRILAWDISKPFTYEFSLNFSPIIGYAIGFYFKMI